MVSRLIFLRSWVCDEGCKLFLLIGLIGAVKDFQEIAPTYDPYLKPTQVDW
jgi:hypothetical protein